LGPLLLREERNAVPVCATGRLDGYRGVLDPEEAILGRLLADVSQWATFASGAWGDALPDEAGDAHHLLAPWDADAGKLAALAPDDLALAGPLLDAVARQRLVPEEQAALAPDKQGAGPSGAQSCVAAAPLARLEQQDELQSASAPEAGSAAVLQPVALQADALLLLPESELRVVPGLQMSDEPLFVEQPAGGRAFQPALLVQQSGSSPLELPQALLA